MADAGPPDGVPTWLSVVLSVLTTVAGMKAWGPIGRWLDRRIETAHQIRAAERGDVIARLTVDLKASREENVELRRELAEERELRMSFAADYAGMKERVTLLERVMAEDKKECQAAIRSLRAEIRELKRQQSGDYPRPGEPLP